MLKRAKYFGALVIVGMMMVGTLQTPQDRPAPVTAEVNAQDNVVNVYSARHYGALEAPFEAFTAATGIEVRVSQGSPQALLERLRAEGDRTPADVFLAIDAGVLSLAAEEGLLQPIESALLLENIAPEYRDPNNYWFGLSIRVRTIAYNPDFVDPEDLSTYAALADPEWEGRLCMRPATHIYTISLVSSLIYHLGEEEALEVVEGWVANDPIYIDSDTRILETVASGGCDVGLINHYYYANLLAQNPDLNAKLFWVNQDEGGTFFNINGAGVTTNARNRENAIAFIEYLSSLEGQAGTPEGFPGSNNELPTNPVAEPFALFSELGEFQLNVEYPLWEYGDYQQAAVELLENAGYGFEES